MQKTFSFIVVGAGISGIRTALNFAELGYKVCLLDRSASSGGILNQLDHQFPDNHCGMCRMLPMIDRDSGLQLCLRKGVFHKNIEFMPQTQVVDVQGLVGQLKITVTKQAAGIDPLRCTGCGNCESVCPETTPDQFNAHLSMRKAVYLPIPHQIPNFRVIDWETCTRCAECLKVCPVKAINLENKPHTFKVEAAALILSQGAELYDPIVSDLYGYGQLSSVVTATAFERMLSSSGPYKKYKNIKKIAWIQCVGSRNLMLGADYCSNVCCMFSVKEALLAYDRIPDGEFTIFYMDLRAYGRDFQKFVDQAESKGIRLIRCRIHSIEPFENTDALRISYFKSGAIIDEVFDLAVLAVGRRPGQALPVYADHDGVIKVNQVPEIKDIAQAVISADNAAAQALEMIKTPLDYSDDADYESNAHLCEDEPQIEVVVCNCGHCGSLTVDIIKTEFAQQTGINFIGVDNACTPKGWADLLQRLKESSANRLLLILCNPHVYLPLLSQLQKETQIATALTELIDLPALERHGRAVDDIKMALNRLRYKNSQSEFKTDMLRPVFPTGLVIGGGPAGISAALHLAQQGFDVDLVEKSETIGGNISWITPEKIRLNFSELINAAKAHTLIRIHYQSEVMQTYGHTGRFITKIKNQNKTIELTHGAVIIATGGRRIEIEASGLKPHKKIVSLFDLACQTETSNFTAQDLKQIVMIQCVGSREEPHNYCSRICCPKALNTAIKIKELNPETCITIFYRDIMTYGESEKLYTKARQKGILFIPYTKTRKPVVKSNSAQVLVEGFDPIMGQEIILQPDLVVLALGLETRKDLPPVFNLKTTCNGFLKEADSKWRPLDSGREGVFIAGLIRGPLRADEAVMEGRAAAQRSLQILTRKQIKIPSMVAFVRPSLCSQCELCIQNCPYEARYADLETNSIMVDTAACQSCGSCAAVCPNSATIITGCEENSIMEALELN